MKVRLFTTCKLYSSWSKCRIEFLTFIVPMNYFNIRWFLIDWLLNLNLYFRCNCNSTVGGWYRADFTEVREDFGVITDHFVLPIRSIFAIRPTSVDRFVKLDVGPLICSDGRHFDPVKNTIRNLFWFDQLNMLFMLLYYV